MAVAIKAINNLNMNNNEIQNFKLHNVAGDISATGTNNGVMYLDTTTGTPKFLWNGTVNTFSVGGSYVLPAATTTTLGGVIIETTSGLTVATDGKLTVTNPYTTTDAATLASAIQGVKINGTAVTPAADQTVDLGDVIVAVGGKIPNAYLPSYVDDVIEVANYTALIALTDMEQGKIYILLNDENVGGVNYKANTQFRWSGSTWVEITKALDFASTAEAQAGTDDTKVMTPKKVLEAIKANPCMAKYSTKVGDGSTTSIIVTHNLNTKDVVVKVYEGDEEVLADVETTTENTVTITFATAPTTDQYRVVIIG